MRTIVTIHSSQQPADGIISTLVLLGGKLPDKIRVKNWNPATKPVFDMFDELRPDLIVCDAHTAPKMNRALQEYGTKLVVCGGMPAHDLQPDLILFNDSVPEMIKKHCEFPYLSISPAANLGKYRNGKVVEDKKSDVLYFASQKEPQNSEASILGLLSSMDLKFKIIGYRRPLLQYVGQTNVYETADFLASAKITIDVNGAQKYDVAAQGGFCLSNKSGLFPHIAEFSPEGWAEAIEDYLGNDDKRTKLAKAIHSQVIKQDTYFHRLADMFIELDWDEEHNQTIEILEQLVAK
jgi:hypothetical protein